MPIVIVDPGHGMDNRKRGRYDPGATAGNYTEAAIVMQWANVLRTDLRRRSLTVVRTRVDANDPCPVSRRDDIARAYKGDLMLSLHCNAAKGKASGVETFYRGAQDKPLAVALTNALAELSGLPNRGAKTEKQSQHPSLAVLDFENCWLLELGFIDNPKDLKFLLDPVYQRQACARIGDVILASGYLKFRA